MFIEQVEEQLRKMSEADKDRWILAQAKLLDESERQGFLLALSGQKKITYMPDDGEIQAFLEKVEKGEIYVEYEAHYYEFDDDGRFMDDWLSWHNDPCGAMDFLDKVFRGCHDLLLLNEYKAAADILDKVCRMRFQVVESPDSDDFDNDSPFTIEDMIQENMLSVNSSDVGEDWVTAFVRKKDPWDSMELAAAMADIFQEPVCKSINPSMLAGEKLPDQFFVHMRDILDQEIREAEKAVKEGVSDAGFSRGEMVLEKKIERLTHLKSDIESKCMG